MDPQIPCAVVEVIKEFEDRLGVHLEVMCLAVDYGPWGAKAFRWTIAADGIHGPPWFAELKFSKNNLNDGGRGDCPRQAIFNAIKRTTETYGMHCGPNSSEHYVAICRERIGLLTEFQRAMIAAWPEP